MLSVDEMAEAARKITGQEELGRSPSEMLHEDKCAVDDQSVGELVPELVREARKAEINDFRSMEVFDQLSLHMCWDVTGCDSISVRWVDTNKGDSQCTSYRSSLVVSGAQHVRQARVVRCDSAGRDVAHHAEPARERPEGQVDIRDVSRAYLFAPAVRAVYVQLPAEDRCPGDQGPAGRLTMSM